MAGKQDRKPFDGDAAHDGAPTSLAVLLKWLRKEGNYARWRGTRRMAGNTKEDLCREIMTLFHSHGLTHRTTRDVRNKMAELERSMAQALTWKETVGSTASAQGGAPNKEQVRAGVRKCCKLFDELEPIMAPFMSKKANDSSVSIATNGCNVMTTSPPKIAIRPPQLPMPVPVSPVIASTRKARPTAMASPQSAPVVTKESSPPPKPQALQAKILGTRSRDEDQRDDGNQQTPVLERAVKKSRLRLEARRLSMEDERLKLELDRQQIQLAKERALARQELRKAHVPENEINRIFPYE